MFTVRPVRKNGAPAGKSRGAAVSKPGSEADLDNGTTSSGTATSDAQEWRAVPGYEGRYEVSDHGLVRGPDGVRDQQVPNKDGYIVTSVDGHKVYIHRLVCLAFHGAPTGPEVRHLDGNPGNNRPSNLAWGTAGENALDRVRHGRDANAQKTHCKHGHSLEDAYLSPNGERECRECRRLYRRAWNMKQKGMMCLT